MIPKIYLIVAVDQKNGIGKDGKIPWHFSKDMKFFKDTTTNTEDPIKLNLVIMGSRTWESIPDKYRPFKGRQNAILTRNDKYEAEGASIHHSLESALEQADETTESIFIIGGGMVFKESIQHPDITGLYITEIDHTYDCDTVFPEIPHTFVKKDLIKKEEESDRSLSFYLYSKSL